MALTGQTVDQVIAAISRNTATAHTAVDQQDVARLKNQVEAIRVVKEIAYQQAMKVVDKSNKTLNKHVDVFRSEIDPKTGEWATNPDGSIKYTKVSEEEKHNLQQSADGKKYVAFNGILNNAKAANKYAQQHNDTATILYTVHAPEAETFLAELLVAGYQKNMENDFFGLSSSAVLAKEYAQKYGAPRKTSVLLA